jgi:hypothetical protein
MVHMASLILKIKKTVIIRHDRDQPMGPELPNLKEKVGKTLTIRGTVSNCPWQHLIQPCPEYPKEFYFDLPNHDQIVVYSKQNLPEKCQLQLTGIIIEIHGGPKKPKMGITKVDASYSEYQMLVVDWRVVT